MTGWNLPPEEIESRSMAIIEDEAPAHQWSPQAWTIVRRMVHTTGDFDFVTSTRMHPRAITAGVEAIVEGRTIVTDTKMARAGMSIKRLEGFGIKVVCLIDHPEVGRMAKEMGCTRAMAAVDLALDTSTVGIYVVGNAPTALFRLLELIAAGKPEPEMIVGLPVGFVNAAESKEALLECPVPYITSLGRKGGSNIAASVINALADLALARNKE